jgi:hypothetical protein
MSRAHANIVAGEGDESDSDDEDWLDDVDVAELTAEDIRAAGLESPFVTPHVTPKAEASNTTFGGNAVPGEVDAGTDAGTGVGTRAVPGDDAGTGGKDTGAMHPHPSSSQNATPRVRHDVSVPNTAAQRKLAARIAAGKKAMYVKHASGRELASSFMRGTEEADTATTSTTASGISPPTSRSWRRRGGRSGRGCRRSRGRRRIYTTEPCEDDDDEGHRGGRSAAKDSTL